MMCFSRRASLRDGASEETREGFLARSFPREHEAERPRPTADREREERDPEESRDRTPVGVGV